MSYQCTYTCSWTDGDGNQQQFERIVTSDGACDLESDEVRSGTPVHCTLTSETDIPGAEVEDIERLPAIRVKGPYVELFLPSTGETVKKDLMEWLDEVARAPLVLQYLRKHGLLDEPRVKAVP